MRVWWTLKCVCVVSLGLPNVDRAGEGRRAEGGGVGILMSRQFRIIRSFKMIDLYYLQAEMIL